MLINSQGYIFECREDSRNRYGVMNGYKLMYRDDELKVTLTLTVDSTGKLVVPSNINRSLGFRSLREQCNTIADVEQFARSNKPCFSVLGEFFLVVAGTIIFDKTTKEVRSTDELGFYVPKTVSHTVREFIDKNSVQQPGLVCEKCSVGKGLNCFTVSADIYNAYLTNFLKSLDVSALEDRGQFLASIIL